MGGNVFENTKSIKLENIESTVQKYFEELSKIFPKNKDLTKDNYKEKFKYIGSVGKKPISGDIDFAIDTSTIMDNYLEKWGLYEDDIKYRYAIFEKRARTATPQELLQRVVLDGIATKINNQFVNLECDSKKITAGNIFTAFPQYSGDTKLDTFVQIDWMCGPIEWLEFSYYSDVYEGNVKGLHRTQLILAMFNNLGLSFNHTKGVSNLDTSEILATTPDEAIKILEKGYNIVLHKEDFYNYFSLFSIISSLNEIVKHKILGIYLKILDRTRCDVPDNLIAYYLFYRDMLGLTGKFLPEDSKVKEKEEDIAV